MENHLFTEPGTRQRIHWLMLARVSIVTLLLIGVSISHLKGMELLPERSLSFYYIIIVLTYTLSFLYIFFQHLIPNIKGNIYIQAACDCATITYLVYVTGGTSSIYSVFYTLVIIYSVVFLERRGGLIIATTCSLLYGTLLSLEYKAIIQPMYVPWSDYPFLPSYVFSRIFSHVLSFYAIAYLASFVVEQEKKVRTLLAEKEDAFNQLDLLHRIILESVHLGILTINNTGKIKSFNRAAQDITGYDYGDVEGKDIGEFLPVRRGLAEEKKRLSVEEDRFEISFRTKHGRELILGCLISPLMNNLAERIGDVLIFQDLTSIKKMEEAYEKSRRMALVGEMASRLAHEIRNPLASISGSIQVLRKDLQLQDSDERLMSIILRGKEQLENFIKDFLLLARPTPGLPEMVNVKEVIEEVLDALPFVPDWHEGISIERSLGEVSVIANRAEIRQVVWNLLLNSIQAMQGQGTLYIDARQEQGSNGGEAYITVVDTGCGIEDKYQHNVFEPFFTTKERGTGLGLAIVNRILEYHRGEITLTSEAGKGTRCRVRLPMKRGDSA